MIVHGREVKFKRTVFAACKLAEICPDKNLNKLGEMLKNVSTSEEQMFMAYFVVCLNEGYESAMKFEDPSYEENPVTMEELMNVEPDVLNELFAEAVTGFNDDKQTVEVEPEKPKKGSKKKAVISG